MKSTSYNVLSYLKRTVERLPDKIAYSDGKQSISYREMDQYAMQLALRIKETHCKNTGIGIIAEQNVFTPVYFLASLYSENYYVPIDPAMPLGKLETILKEGDIKMILCSEACREKYQTLTPSVTLLSMEDRTESTDNNEKNILGNPHSHSMHCEISGASETSSHIDCAIPSISEDTPCYVIYTSGSTGKPKGVVKSHRAIMSFIDCYVNTFGFTSEDIIGNQTPFFFDASAKDIYLAFNTGATIEIIPPEKFVLPPELIEYMNLKKITFISWVPTALSIVAQLRTFAFIKPETLKRVFFVGEVMPMKYLNYWKKHLPDLEYVNLYGQSELAGICCYYKVEGVFDKSDVLPLGRPLGNCRMYLVDEEGVIGGADRVGELYIVSDALANGYFNDPERTAECFLEKDFGEGPVRCFRTGDFARYDTAGNLVFTSRNDSQIKHMGKRIELGEIEAAANSLSVVSRCACVYNSEKKDIVLFVEPAEGGKITPLEVIDMLKPIMSPYMLPTIVNVLESMPLNQNGKIDRNYLKENS